MNMFYAIKKFLSISLVTLFCTAPLQSMQQQELFETNLRGANVTLKLIYQDITTLPVDTVVNAANKRLVRGAGVCGAIFKKAGFTLDQYIRINHSAGCKVGDAVLTPSFGLSNKIKYILHAVGPIYGDHSRQEARRLLKSTYINSLKLAAEKDLRSIAFPFISSGIYGYPKEEAAEVALEAIREYVELHPKTSIDTIYFAFFDPSNRQGAMNNLRLFKNKWQKFKN